MESQHHDVLIVGGGIFGLSTAIELNKRHYNVGLINPDKIPHPLAASTDISKIVRMEYGSDELYFKMAERAIEKWRQWNEVLEEELYVESGILLLCRKPLGHAIQSYERNSYKLLRDGGYNLEVLKSEDVNRRFPHINTKYYPEAVFNAIGGYVKSSRVIERLADYARQQGVVIYEGQTVQQIQTRSNCVQGVKTKEGETLSCERLVVEIGRAHV